MGNHAALSTYKEHFEIYIAENRFLNPPDSLYEPVNYIMSIGGKRFRPLLTILSFSLFDQDFKTVFPVAFAVELFHNFTLVHDDIMDDAGLRRGMQTVHLRFGLNKAILAGDVMLIYANQYLSKGSPEKMASQLLSMFNETAVKICEGQQYDIDFEESDNVALEDYLHMIEFKTASLFGCALALGAIRANANIESINTLFSCGRDMGMAFQIRDDYLDCFGDSNLTGKQIGGDIIQGKKTYPLLIALDQAGDRAEDLVDCFNDKEIGKEEKVEKVLGWYREVGVEEACLTAQHAYFTRAMERLDSVTALPGRREDLKEFFKIFYHRKN
jgi:geranylgeranyl diphosphate synthase type II